MTSRNLRPVDRSFPRYKDYGWRTAAPSHMHSRFLPQIFGLAGDLKPGTRVLDVGCGNGFTSGEFIRRGCQTVGIDLSESGIATARSNYPGGRFEVLPADDELLDRLEEPPFDLVVSTEVVEHLYAPRSYARGCFHALRPGGRFICTTPYHGYLKNLLLSLLGKWDSHANPLWDGGHIKLWSRSTLSQLLTEAGFAHLQFRGAGRMPYLWMTMIMAGDKPGISPVHGSSFLGSAENLQHA
jgi:2-polyprenyl-6-hydroxyphenyl methylase/3-demethylubiquinone-9 3-methyltransferase